MRKIFIILFVLIVSMLQLGIFSHIQVLSGKIDLIMLGAIAWTLQKRTGFIDVLIYAFLCVLFLFLISAEPLIILVILYTFIALFVYWSKNNIQQIPIVSMLIFTTIFTFIHLSIFGFYLQLFGTNLDAIEVFQIVILPSIMINLVAAIPIFLLTNELQHLVYPLVEEV